MHEMSLCESVLQVIENEAQSQGFTRVKRVCLEIGTLSSVEIDAMKFCFDVVIKNSIAQDAELEIDTPPGTLWCMQCAEAFEANERFQACPKCGGHQCQVTGGEEMRIKELEVV